MGTPSDEPLEDFEDADDAAVAGTRLDITAAPGDEGLRLDRMLVRHLPDMSRTRLQALLAEGHLARDGKPVTGGSTRVAAGTHFVLTLPPPEPAEPIAQAIPLAIVYEDDDLIVVDKPAGMVVHPAPGNPDGTLVNALLYHCGDSLSGVGGVRRPGIVHRLDKETSGLLVVAKNDRSHRALAEQFADHGRTGPLERLYVAFAWGVPEQPRGTVDAPLARHPVSRERIAVRAGGRFAITHWERTASYDDAEGRPVASRIECRLETGRTHQIRVHLGHIGHPLLGDALYGQGFRTKAGRLTEPARSALEALSGQALHAARLGFAHPVSGKVMRFESPLRPDLARLEAALAQAD
ncbi:RluA family pseudouridine synthase [Ancylobacter sp. Lp-2]|uniref:RluA family pseudouridine synthase n=1 Tax=Ancylobacter sp. Lp-2 TaxID=2881339 RepID=UPI001E49D383|nr:RluA family pseudouridine synthase [Ancylobacter sp. Lp-2]MCB4771975.1 RluA family pseudouridine synthase [Ancylobacter sp. Lp-2]